MLYFLEKKIFVYLPLFICAFIIIIIIIICLLLTRVDKYHYA